MSEQPIKMNWSCNFECSQEAAVMLIELFKTMGEWNTEEEPAEQI